MSLYYEAADLLTAPTNAGGSLKSRIFSKKDLKSQPAQIYALAIETCKWSTVLKEVVEYADLLRLERKVTPILSILLVHDLLLAKRGIALPATHGLRTSIERHKARLQAEFTKARIRRKLSTVEALKAHIESGLENASDTSDSPHPRWVRINTLKTTLEDQLDTTFAGYEYATTVDAVRQRGSKRLFIDNNIPNLLAITPSIDMSKSDAYRSGDIIFQDKASCFPAYLLDPLPEDGDIVDTCSAPGNKTTHIAAILLAHNSEPDECSQSIHAFEKNKGRAETLEKMVNVAGSQPWTKLHPGQDFLKTDPDSPAYKNVGALLLDPSCSGSGIVGRDEMPELHLPNLKEAAKTGSKPPKKGGKAAEPKDESRKRKREDNASSLEVMVDDDGEVTAVNSEEDLRVRLEALSKFQLELLFHAFKFPAARKITYSTCSIHAEENESVVQKALAHPTAKERGWRIQKRSEQIRGMREWPVRGLIEACNSNDELADACIRANKDDEHGTMGFFLAGFVRDQPEAVSLDAEFLRDERGHLVRDLMGIPVRVQPQDDSIAGSKDNFKTLAQYQDDGEEEEEWAGFEDDVKEEVPKTKAIKADPRSKGQKHDTSSTEKGNTMKKRPQLGIKPDKKRRKK
ncbi:S-adenosyl-L-methionine-dependent methyltransferase [Mollisia scopiformis]|uniref:S-adenosyl-L-methionine-dependent methyltransferase n=1 Tax=Mollisia scopiformis TaxID=149040 RepID=A0A194XL40_MOLSC|nr:S-adenosyl-L-methionine-dependent methyltransferase [Mollisia scopiformis]KUJ20950.1 S-adenosyl-L-methionine-dependent methyltransferase [Mollisia scopiformis]